MALTKNQIIKQLYESVNFNSCINKMEPGHLRADLKAEVVLILLETPAEKIIQMNSTGQLPYYAVRIIINQIQSNSSPFAKMYRKTVTSYVSDIDEHADLKLEYIKQNPVTEDQETLQERETREQWEDRIKDLTFSEINKLYWYDRDMILLYQKLGSFREIERRTRIPSTSCYDTIKKAMNIIKSNVTNTDNIPAR